MHSITAFWRTADYVRLLVDGVSPPVAAQSYDVAVSLLGRPHWFEVRSGRGGDMVQYTPPENGSN